MSNLLLVIIFAILILPGFAGILLPFPSVPYMFVIALIYGLISKFVTLTGLEILILGLLAILSLLTDYFSGVLGAKYGGASKSSIIVGCIGLLIGIALFPPFGGIIGLFVGVLISELIQFGKYRQAVKAATGSFLGTVTGMVINIFLGLLFVVLFTIFAIK